MRYVKLVAVVFLFYIFRDHFIILGLIILSIIGYFVYKITRKEKIIIHEISQNEEDLLSTIDSYEESNILTLLEWYDIDYVSVWCSNTYGWDDDYSYRIVNAINKKYELVYE